MQPVSVRSQGMHALVEHDGLRDEVAVEEPLEIRVDGRPLAVTMRTPGHDDELALGFLVGEGLIETVREARPPPDMPANTVDVPGPLLREPAARSFYTSSSCGVCGKGALEEVRVLLPGGGSVRGGGGGSAAPRLPRELLASLPERLTQPEFSRTGGMHATGLFTSAGELIYAREDVGRHNAMDKVVGRALLDGLLPLDSCVLCVSGRLSFELVQKAALAGCLILVGVGAPTSLAVSLAGEIEMTLCGFARGGRVNVYAGSSRVV